MLPSIKGKINIMIKIYKLIKGNYIFTYKIMILPRILILFYMKLIT